MNNCKYLCGVILVAAISVATPICADWYMPVFYCEMPAYDKMFHETERLDKPQITVTQDDNEMVVKLAAAHVSVNDMTVEVENNRCLTARIPGDRGTIVLKLYNDENIQRGVVSAVAHVKTLDEVKDDKGVIISQSSGVSQVSQSQILPKLIGSLDDVKIKYENNILVLHIPLYKDSIKKINVEVCNSPGLK
ncbi:MAG: hypothetical protein WC707_03780 [Candidatus Babeliaceae bacterium]|jgi:HSP20 family molecular chaperone IbpA